MMRPRFLVLLALAACGGSAPPPEAAVPAPPPPPPVVITMPTADEIAARELTADEQIKQAINRLSFGPRPGEYDSVRAIGVDVWVARQLVPSHIPDSAAENFVSRFPSLTQSPQQLLALYPPASVQRRRAGGVLLASDSAAIQLSVLQARHMIADLQTAKVARAVISERQLNEVMVDFWFNHFNVYAAKGSERYYLSQYERDVIRPYALGNFRVLLGAVAHSTAMLYYLDNWQSRANGDEPVLVAEKDVDPGNQRLQPHGATTQPGSAGRMGGNTAAGAARGPRTMPTAPRTQAAAPGKRASAGLNENYARELMELHTLGVDGGYTQEDVVNVARAFTGWTISQPQQLATFLFRPQWHDAGSKTILSEYFPAGHGQDEGERVLDILARDPHTAQHIAAQLVTRFVSDTPPPELVARAAAAFTKSGGDIRETMRVIVQSPEFFSRASYKVKVKSPLRLVASALRAVNAAPDSTPRTSVIVARLGEPLYQHLAPNGYPLTGESWINTGAILNRINFGLAVAAGHVPGATLARWPEGLALSRDPHDAQVDGVIALLLEGEASPDTRRILQNGTNPFIANAPADSERQAKSDSLAALAEMEADMIGMGVAPEPGTTMDGEGAEAAPPPRPQPALGLKRAGLLRGPDPLAKPADLTGFAQMMGLALGAPEFQRH